MFRYNLKLFKVRKAFIEQEASAPQQQAPKQKVQQPDPRAEEWAEENTIPVFIV